MALTVRVKTPSGAVGEDMLIAPMDFVSRGRPPLCRAAAADNRCRTGPTVRPGPAGLLPHAPPPPSPTVARTPPPSPSLMSLPRFSPRTQVLTAGCSGWVICDDIVGVAKVMSAAQDEFSVWRERYNRQCSVSFLL